MSAQGNTPPAQPVAVITGGSTGIGFATVEALLQAGWRVAFFGQQGERVESAKRALEAKFPAEAIHAVVADLRVEPAVRSFFAQVGETFGPVEALVCNAAYSPKGPDGRVPLAEISSSEWEDVLRVNLTGAFLCCRAVLPGMVETGRGRIILVGSVAGRTLPRVAGAAYVASKSALTGLARSLVAEYSQFGITVNTVCPGRILSDMAGPADSPTNQAALDRIPIGRLGQPNDIARVIEFLVRPSSDFINGTVIDVNGGEFVPV